MARATNGRLTIKGGVYRGKPGFKLSGTDPKQRSVRVFCRTYEGAVQVKLAIKSGFPGEITRLLLAGA